MKPKFKYKVFTFKCKNRRELIKSINSIGKEGWEVVKLEPFHPDDVDDHDSYVYAKKTV